MKKISIVLIICFIFTFNIRVLADQEPLVIDTDYTTVYKGDEINLSIGYPIQKDDLFVEELNNEYVEGRIDKYKGSTIIFAVEKDKFEVDFTNATAGDNFVFYDFADKKNINNLKTSKEYSYYLIYLDLKSVREKGDKVSDTYFYDKYNGKNIGDILLSNIILKVKDDAKIGTSFIHVDYYDYIRDMENEEETSYKDRDVFEYFDTLYPINIIEENKIKNDKIIIESDIKTYEKELSKDVKELEQIWSGERIEYINYVCSKRCHASNVAANTVIEYNIQTIPFLKFNIDYYDNTKREIIINASNWYKDIENLLVIADSGATKYNMYARYDDIIQAYETSFIKDYRCYSLYGVPRTIKLFDTDKSTDKQSLKHLNDYDPNEKKVQVFKYKNGKLINKIVGEATREELAEKLGNGYLYKKVYYCREGYECSRQYAQNSMYMLENGELCPTFKGTIFEDSDYGETTSEESNIKDITDVKEFINDNLFYVLLGTSIFVIIILIVIILIIVRRKNKKTKDNEKVLNNN